MLLAKERERDLLDLFSCEMSEPYVLSSGLVVKMPCCHEIRTSIFCLVKMLTKMGLLLEISFVSLML